MTQHSTRPAREQSRCPRRPQSLSLWWASGSCYGENPQAQHKLKGWGLLGQSKYILPLSMWASLRWTTDTETHGCSTSNALQKRDLKQISWSLPDITHWLHKGTHMINYPLQAAAIVTWRLPFRGNTMLNFNTTYWCRFLTFRRVPSKKLSGTNHVFHRPPVSNRHLLHL